MIQRPPWLIIKSVDLQKIDHISAIMQKCSLNTICQSASCPNMGECFAAGTATFLIMGNTCTRNCRFCAVLSGEPELIDEQEPQNLAAAVEALGLKYVVITSVTRDDLPDGGAAHFARSIEAVRMRNPGVSIEVLVPDFQGQISSLEAVLSVAPQVLNHNMETVERLYEEVRPGAVYRRSLELLNNAKRAGEKTQTKSGLMLGLGETTEEVLQAMRDLHDARCDILTLGQYLSPSTKHYPVARFVNPAEFEEYRQAALEAGFKHVSSGPLVRSSYRAGNQTLHP